MMRYERKYANVRRSASCRTVFARNGRRAATPAVSVLPQIVSGTGVAPDNVQRRGAAGPQLHRMGDGAFHARVHGCRRRAAPAPIQDDGTRIVARWDRVVVRGECQDAPGGFIEAPHDLRAAMCRTA